jgi:hypothetical protein
VCKIAHVIGYKEIRNKKNPGRIKNIKGLKINPENRPDNMPRDMRILDALCALTVF